MPRLLSRRLAAAASGALLVAAMPPHGLPGLAWVALCPLLVAVRGLAWRPALRLGLLAGWVLGLGTFAFLIDTLEVFAELPRVATLPILALFAAWVAVPLGLWTALLARVLGPRAPDLSPGTASATTNLSSVTDTSATTDLSPGTATLGAKHLSPGTAASAATNLSPGTAAPAARTTPPAPTLGAALGRAVVVALTFTGVWSLWPALFAFSPVFGLSGRPAWIQAAELGGVALVELLALACSALLADAAATTGAARLRRLACAAAIPLLATLLGAWRIASLAQETTRTLRVGLVQPNIPLLWDDKQARLDRLRRPSAAAAAAGAALIVWPENIYPWPLDRPFLRDFSDADRVLAEHRVPTIFGAGNVADDDPYGYNSAFLMAADGAVLARYDKIALVPLGERIPLVDPEWAKRQAVGMAHNFAGDAPVRFVVGDPAVALGPLICYEDIFPDLARAAAALPGGVDAFVNLTNDTWFGVTAEPSRHLALAQFRSVEHRVPTVRSVNSGPSALIDRAGRVAATTELRPASADTPAEHLVVDVELGRNTAARPTPFARGGWLLVHACQAFAALVVLAALHRRR
ncbi:MAG: apolipoprotein N-acyltransferase [Myxococcales bacterium]|nr:apolipoprotein N-acyltransferase [Myxococcales bacterium]